MGYMSNHRLGGRFEERFARMLYDQGFWVLRVPMGYSGQPADIVAVKQGRSVLIDCKACSTSRGFAFSRIEDNQRYSMTLFEERGNGYTAFAFELPDGRVRILSSYVVFAQERLGKSRLTNEEILEMGSEVTEWVREIFE